MGFKKSDGRSSRIISQGEAGFTLIEIIIAMIVLLIIITAFTPLITTSILRIYNAGYRSQALAGSQSEVESKLLSMEAADSEILNLSIDDEDLSVRVSYVEIEKEVNEMNSELTGVVPLVPTISIDPSQLVEGYQTIDIDVYGYDTNFTTDTPTLSIYNYDGTLVTGGPSYSLQVGTKVDGIEKATINLGTGLTNSKSPYMIELKTSDRTVRARLQVDLPDFCAVGVSGTILVSPDSSHWASTYSSQIPTSNPINNIIWRGSQYLAVGNNGIIMSLSNREPWKVITSGVTNHLNKVSWLNGSFFIVGDGGLILNSADGRNWSIRDTGTLKNLNSISWGNGKYVAVGSEGTIIQSNDGIEWGAFTFSGEEGLPGNDLNHVCWIDGFNAGNGYFLAVGNGGTVLKSTMTEGEILLWENYNGIDDESTFFDNLTVNLNSIALGVSSLVIVGDSGNVITFKDGVWNDVSDAVNTTSKLNYVYYIIEEVDETLTELYIAVGDGGAIITSSDGMVWNVKSSGVSNQLKGVTCRY